MRLVISKTIGLLRRHHGRSRVVDQPAMTGRSLTPAGQGRPQLRETNCRMQTNNIHTAIPRALNIQSWKVSHRMATLEKFISHKISATIGRYSILDPLMFGGTPNDREAKDAHKHYNGVINCGIFCDLYA
jgi:hypothetical protein